MNFVEYGFNFTCEEKICIFHSWLRAVKPQKIEISDKVVEGLYFPCSENKGVDQLRGYHEADRRLCFRICKIAAFLMTRLI